MSNIEISNFCELFGFNNKEYPVSRLPIKIKTKIYREGYVFKPGNLYNGFDISKHIDDLALVYYDEKKNVVLHMFVPDGKADTIFVNRLPEKRLYRYSEFEKINDAYENGNFKIYPALEYIKKEYDEARKDNEQVHSRNVSSDNTKIIFKKNNKATKPIGELTNYTISLPVDSYILCFSYEYDEVLYDEFKGSDSCLVINDVDKFVNRMHTSFKKLMPKYSGCNSRVTYSKHLSPFGVLFSKPQKYIYQREYRFVWLPHDPKQMVEPIKLINNEFEELRELIPKPVKISLGSLKDIASIIVKNKGRKNIMVKNKVKKNAKKRACRKKRSPEELRKASDHLHYEVWMLKCMAIGINSGLAGNSVINNAFIESFVIHARVLLDFFYPFKHRQDDVIAIDFFDRPKTWEEARPEKTDILKKIHKRVGKEAAHLTYSRLKVSDEQKNWDHENIAHDIGVLVDCFLGTVSNSLLGDRWNQYKK